MSTRRRIGAKRRLRKRRKSAEGDLVFAVSRMPNAQGQSLLRDYFTNRPCIRYNHAAQLLRFDEQRGLVDSSGRLRLVVSLDALGSAIDEDSRVVHDRFPFYFLLVSGSQSEIRVFDTQAPLELDDCLRYHLRRSLRQSTVGVHRTVRYSLLDFPSGFESASTDNEIPNSASCDHPRKQRVHMTSALSS